MVFFYLMMLTVVVLAAYFLITKVFVPELCTEEEGEGGTSEEGAFLREDTLNKIAEITAKRNELRALKNDVAVSEQLKALDILLEAQREKLSNIS